MTLTPTGYNNPAPTLRMLDEHTASGHKLTTLLADRGFSNWEVQDWADGLLRRDIDQIIGHDQRAVRRTRRRVGTGHEGRMSGGELPMSTAHTSKNDETPHQKPFRAPREGFCHFEGFSCVRNPWR
ncbi:MAG: hypothetical protein HHJ10_14835 [Cellulomonas sp.]|uniref:hypothetical protein n=1 Tax=Cellulomonas sp. TaxID=40001 RepID=UPI0017C509A2|nr:hypothetical protein [Cellulomonas sp.]NMM32273.1 hypothetical protein [Cellulomonas sp.]